jgi:hypothetical protein
MASRLKSSRAAIAALVVVSAVHLLAQNPRPAPAPQPARAALPVTNWAEWVEPDFPFFSSVVDARAAGNGFPATNLTPRGLVLNLGGGHWAAFDTDLLRVAAIWNAQRTNGDEHSQGVTPKALAPGSYHHPDRKTQGGQSPAPEPDGKVQVANGIYPGWQTGASPSFADPREPAPTPEEVGRGPLTEEMGRFNDTSALDLRRSSCGWCWDSPPTPPQFQLGAPEVCLRRSRRSRFRRGIDARVSSRGTRKRSGRSVCHRTPSRSNSPLRLELPLRRR